MRVSRQHLHVLALALLVLAITPRCTRVMPPPTPAQLVGSWRVVVPMHWLEKKVPMQIDLRLESNGTYFERERLGNGEETAAGRWSIVSGRRGPEALFRGLNDNGTPVSFTRPLYRRIRGWVVGHDGGPDLGSIYFERVRGSANV